MAAPKFFDIVTKPNFGLIFNSPMDHPSTIDIAVHNPNHSTTLAYYIRITHPGDFIVVPSKGLLEPVDNKMVRVTRRPNVKYHPNDTLKVIYTEVANETPRVDLKMFDQKDKLKTKQLLIKHENLPT